MFPQWFTDHAEGEAKIGGTLTWIFEKFDYRFPYEILDARPAERSVLSARRRADTFFVGGQDRARRRRDRPPGRPVGGDCGLSAYPASRSHQEILEAVPPTSTPSNGLLVAKLRIDPDGKITHLQVLRVGYPESPELNEQALQSLRQWDYTSPAVDDDPSPLCIDVSVGLHFRGTD